jgi:hypothetical protein
MTADINKRACDCAPHKYCKDCAPELWADYVSKGVTEAVFANIRDERDRQREKWGQQRHEMPVWMTILMEEVGEACKDALAWRSTTAQGNEAYADQSENFRNEMVQVAAVAVAIIEAMDLDYSGPGTYGLNDIETEARP